MPRSGESSGGFERATRAADRTPEHESTGVAHPAIEARQDAGTVCGGFILISIAALPELVLTYDASTRLSGGR